MFIRHKPAYPVSAICIRYVARAKSIGPIKSYDASLRLYSRSRFFFSISSVFDDSLLNLYNDLGVLSSIVFTVRQKSTGRSPRTCVVLLKDDVILSSLIGET